MPKRCSVCVNHSAVKCKRIVQIVWKLPVNERLHWDVSDCRTDSNESVLNTFLVPTNLIQPRGSRKQDEERNEFQRPYAEISKSFQTFVFDNILQQTLC